jgi:hypothetical protein
MLCVAEFDSIRIIARHVYLPSLYFIIFSLPNIYMHIIPSGIIIGNATANVALAMPSPASLGGSNTPSST